MFAFNHFYCISGVSHFILNSEKWTWDVLQALLFSRVHSQWDLLRKYLFVERWRHESVSTLQMLPTVALKWSKEMSKPGEVASLIWILTYMFSGVWMSWGNRTTERQCLSSGCLENLILLLGFWTPVFVLACIFHCVTFVWCRYIFVSKACIYSCSSFKANSWSNLWCSYLINKSSLTEWWYVLSGIIVVGHGKWLVIGRFPVSDSEVPKDKSMAYSRPNPIAETGGRSIWSLNPGKCQRLPLEKIWWLWMVVFGTRFRASLNLSHLAKLALSRWWVELGTNYWKCLGLCKTKEVAGRGRLWNGHVFQPVPCWRLHDWLSTTYSSPGRVWAVILQLCHHMQTAEEIYRVMPQAPEPSCITMEPSWGWCHVE